MTQNTNPWAKQIDPLAQDIAAVLRSMGGSAHQRDVVQCVAAMKRQRGETVAQDLANKIVEAFERYRDLFFKPFGEGSMRWALQPGVAWKPGPGELPVLLARLAAPRHQCGLGRRQPGDRHAVG